MGGRYSKRKLARGSPVLYIVDPSLNIE